MNINIIKFCTKLFPSHHLHSWLVVATVLQREEWVSGINLIILSAMNGRKEWVSSPSVQIFRLEVSLWCRLCALRWDSLARQRHNNFLKQLLINFLPSFSLQGVRFHHFCRSIERRQSLITRLTWTRWQKGEFLSEVGTWTWHYGPELEKIG
jgi:hypothetical protein